MTRMDCACLLRELEEYNREGELLTPQNKEFDTIFQCALQKGRNALETLEGFVPGGVRYTKNPNGSFDMEVGL